MRDSCQKKLADLGKILEPSTICDSPRDEPYADVPEAMAVVNRCLSEIR